MQLAPEEMKSSSDESGQFREVRNSFDGLNHSISGAIHTCYNIDPKSEHEWGLFRGEPVISSKECNSAGSSKLVDSGFACEKFKRIGNKVGHRNYANCLRIKDKDIQ